MRGHRELLGIPFKFPRRIQYPLDDSADPGAEILDELIELCFALFHRQLLGTDALGLELAAFETVVLEDADGPCDRTDLVVPVGVPDFDVCPSLAANCQRFRHGP